MKLKFYFLFLFNFTLILTFRSEKNENEIPLYSEGKISETTKKKNDNLENHDISKNNDYIGKCILKYNLEKHENKSLSEENENKKKIIHEELKNDTNFTTEEQVYLNDLKLRKINENKNDLCDNDTLSSINSTDCSDKDSKWRLAKTSFNNKKEISVLVNNDENGYGNLSHSFTSEQECLSETLSTNYFMKGFLSKICLNESYRPYYSKKYLSLMYRPSYEYYNKKLFFYLIENTGYKEAYSRIINTKKNVAIFNFFYGKNYGAILTAYSLQTILLKLGYNPYLIGKAIDKISFTQFIDENLFSGGINGYNGNIDKLKSLNKYYNNFVVGSDQVWRYEYTKNSYEVFFLSFVEKNKNKIACAASFGTDHWEGSRKLLRKIRKYIKSFNKITVREKSGVKICKNTFKAEAKAIFDPVFYLKNNYWNKLLDRSTLNLSTSNLIYILDRSEKIANQINSILERVNPIQHWINIGNTSINDFLKGIQSSQRVITDSFHGVCFSIIFHKDFICLCNKNRGKERFTSLLSDLGLMNRLFYDLTEVNLEKLPPIDYSLVDKIIEQKRQEGIQFLQSNL
ncbi:polysaccharide pyruvyl transferase-domain-containing protein [Neocallimastix sp. 'constans']